LRKKGFPKNTFNPRLLAPKRREKRVFRREKNRGLSPSKISLPYMEFKEARNLKGVVKTLKRITRGIPQRKNGPKGRPLKEIQSQRKGTRLNLEALKILVSNSKEGVPKGFIPANPKSLNRKKVLNLKN